MVDITTGSVDDGIATPPSVEEDTAAPKDSTPPVLRSDNSHTNSTKASKKSTGSANSSGSDRNGYPSQIVYNSNPVPNGHGHRIRMQPPPGSPGSYQLNDGTAAGYPPHPMHAYQLSSSPIVITTQAPSGISFSPSGGNYPPHMMNPHQGGLPPTPPTLPYQQRQDLNSSGNGSRNPNGNLGRSTHRRSNSYNGPQGSSSFFSPQGSGAPPLPRRSGSKAGASTGGRQRANSEDFSPVAEVRKLTGTGAGVRPPVSPGHRGSGSSRHNRAKSEDWQMHMSYPGPMFPTSFTGGSSSPLEQHSQRNYSYQNQQPQPMIYNRGVYMGDSGDDSISGSVRSIRNSKETIGDDGSEGGGEAVFLLNKNSSRKASRRGGSRTKRRHMRQHSAQLFMEEVKGTEQLPSCRDIIFLLLFVFHLLGIVYLGRTYGNEALLIHDESLEESESSVTIILMNMIYLAGLSGVFAMVVSGLTLLLMATIANKIVQIAIILSITFSFLWGTMGVGLTPKKIVPITGIIALGLSVAYAFIVWDRIPFAAANLNAGLSGILANPGAIFVSFIFQILSLGWSVYYIFVGFGVYDAIQEGEIDESFEGAGYVYFCLLGISYYWTLNVFLNIVQVTVADVIGKWWYTPDGDTSSRGADLNHAFFRSVFYSVGSICFGSLFVGPVRILRQFSVFFRPPEEVHSLMTLHECMHCIQSCLTNCVESLARRFSPWSFTYVGLYGYGLIDAGLHSAELFDKRGWTTIVSDDLVPNVLLLMTFTITGLTGVFAHLLQRFESLALTASQEPLVTPFVVGALVGLVVSSVLFGIISSSVNAVIVLFATSPVDFEQNHPELSEEMRTAWREVWPGCMDVVDLRVQVAGFLDPTMTGSMRGQPVYNAGLSSSYRAQAETHPLLR
ncbi:unnamed protein product [Pseudo-nitzschia multistriata]|uniref:Uncharacterized protein n=1 Tax=Pseudo-nitzschia multistriata TaxID=183589 RepID=A0A448Z6G5_9STRA|nr:unnamed protein product [Pseudo-nitzschia multistriata]